MNNTDKDLNYILQRKLLANYRDHWRQRQVRLFEGETPDMVYSVGVPDDQRMVIAHEPRKHFWSKLGDPHP